MTIPEFVDELQMRYPRGRLSADQRASFEIAIRGLSEATLDRILDPLSQTCDLPFPSVAAVYRTAKETMMSQPERPVSQQEHKWAPTTCPNCAGEGRVLLLGEFKEDTSGNRWFEVERAVGYTSREASSIRGPADRVFMRCVCPAGDAPTLGTGVRKWSGAERIRCRG